MYFLLLRRIKQVRFHYPVRVLSYWNTSCISFVLFWKETYTATKPLTGITYWNLRQSKWRPAFSPRVIRTGLWHTKTFVNRCLRYILRIWWPKITYDKDLWRATGQEDINLEIRKRKFRWIGHTSRKEDGKYQKPPFYGTLKEAGREEDLRLAGEDRSPKKWVEAGTNYGSWLLIDRSGKNS